MVVEVKERLEARDQNMVEAYLKRGDLQTFDVRTCFREGDRVLLRQKRPGKLLSRCLGPFYF